MLFPSIHIFELEPKGKHRIRTVLNRNTKRSIEDVELRLQKRSLNSDSTGVGRDADGVAVWSESRLGDGDTGVRSWFTLREIFVEAFSSFAFHIFKIGKILNLNRASHVHWARAIQRILRSRSLEWVWLGSFPVRSMEFGLKARISSGSHPHHLFLADTKVGLVFWAQTSFVGTLDMKLVPPAPLCFDIS